ASTIATFLPAADVIWAIYKIKSHLYEPIKPILLVIAIYNTSFFIILSTAGLLLLFRSLSICRFLLSSVPLISRFLFLNFLIIALKAALFSAYGTLHMVA